MKDENFKRKNVLIGNGCVIIISARMQKAPIWEEIGARQKGMIKEITFCGKGHYTLFSYPLQKEVKRTMAKKQKPLKPGQITPTSGQYGVVGPKGGKTNTEVTAVEGKPLPPTPKPGQGYVLVDKTKHKGK